MMFVIFCALFWVVFVIRTNSIWIRHGWRVLNPLPETEHLFRIHTAADALSETQGAGACLHFPEAAVIVR